MPCALGVTQSRESKTPRGALIDFPDRALALSGWRTNGGIPNGALSGGPDRWNVMCCWHSPSATLRLRILQHRTPGRQSLAERSPRTDNCPSPRHKNGRRDHPKSPSPQLEIATRSTVPSLDVHERLQKRSLSTCRAAPDPGLFRCVLVTVELIRNQQRTA
jgi:hypothetical protein